MRLAEHVLVAAHVVVTLHVLGRRDHPRRQQRDLPVQQFLWRLFQLFVLLGDLPKLVEFEDGQVSLGLALQVEEMPFDRNLAAFVAFGLRGKHLLEVLLVALDDVGHAVEFLELVLEAAERLLLVAVELAVLLLLDVQLAFLAIIRLRSAEHEVVVSLNLAAEITLLLVDGVVDLL